MGKMIPTITETGYYGGFLRNGLFGDSLSTFFAMNDNMGRMLALILSFVLAAAVLVIAAENFKAGMIVLVSLCFLLIILGGMESVLAISAIYSVAAVTMIGIFMGLIEKEADV